MADVERLDAQAVAGEDEAFSRFAPERDGEHAAEAGETCGVPFKEGVENGFGVAAGMEAMAVLFELAADFQMIVDFAVEDDAGVAVVGNDGLITGVEVDNFQTSGAEGKKRGGEDADLIGAAMNKGVGGGADAIGRGRPALTRESSYATQIQSLSPAENQLLVVARSRRTTAGRTQSRGSCP